MLFFDKIKSEINLMWRVLEVRGANMIFFYLLLIVGIDLIGLKAWVFGIVSAPISFLFGYIYGRIRGVYNKDE